MDQIPEYLNDTGNGYNVSTKLSDTDLERTLCGNFDKNFESQVDLENFFIYVKLLFYTYEKAFEFRTNQFVRKIWYSSPSDSLCFCTKARPTEQPPLFRIKLKANAPSFESTEEKVNYFFFNEPCEGIPEDIAQSIVSLYDHILKLIYSERIAETLGSSGILSFMLNIMIQRNKSGVQIINVHKYDDVDKEVTVILGYTLTKSCLTIFESKNHKYSTAPNRTIPRKNHEKIEYKISFYQPTFPQELRIIDVESKDIHVLNQEVHTTCTKLNADSIFQGLFSTRDENTTMVNFLEFFMHIFLLVNGLKTSVNARNTAVRINYHPLVMEKLTWRLFQEFVIARNRGNVQVNVLRDDLSHSGTVDMGGPTKKFIEDVSRQLFREQTKKLILYSTGRIVVDFFPKTSILSSTCWFPIFFEVENPSQKHEVVVFILEFFKMVYLSHQKIPFVIHPKFFTIFREMGYTLINPSCRQPFTSTRMYNKTYNIDIKLFKWEHVHRENVLITGEYITQNATIFIPEEQLIVKYKRFLDSYLRILYSTTKEINSHEEPEKNDFALNVSVFMSKYFCGLRTYANVLDCHQHVIDMSKWQDDAPGSMTTFTTNEFFSDLKTILNGFCLLDMIDIEEEMEALKPKVMWPSEEEFRNEKPSGEWRETMLAEEPWSEEYTLPAGQPIWHSEGPSSPSELVEWSVPQRSYKTYREFEEESDREFKRRRGYDEGSDEIVHDSPLKREQDDPNEEEKRILLELWALCDKKIAHGDSSVLIQNVSQHNIDFITQKCINYLKSLYDPAIEFLFYLRRWYDSNVDNEISGGVQWNKISGEDLQSRIMSTDLDRQHVANLICLDPSRRERDMSPLFMNKIKWLKEHIVDESTPIEWVRQFLKAVTGSSYLHSDDSIKVTPLNFERNSYCTSHTCTNVLDVSPQYNDLPGISDEELRVMDPKDIFIRNLSEGLLANNNVMELV